MASLGSKIDPYAITANDMTFSYAVMRVYATALDSLECFYMKHLLARLGSKIDLSRHEKRHDALLCCHAFSLQRLPTFLCFECQYTIHFVASLCELHTVIFSVHIFFIGFYQLNFLMCHICTAAFLILFLTGRCLDIYLCCFLKPPHTLKFSSGKPKIKEYRKSGTSLFYYYSWR